MKPRRYTHPVMSGLLLFLGFFLGNPAAASTNYVSRALMGGDADLVVVMKSERELYLYREGRIMAKYPISLGLNPIGNKHREGDNKTPVGAYMLDRRNPDSSFHLSLHISYPNAEDRDHAAAMGVDPGGAIMLHGQPSYDDRPRSGDWTNGCIAVSDAAINQIWAHVPDGTPIHIYP